MGRAEHIGWSFVATVVVVAVLGAGIGALVGLAWASVWLWGSFYPFAGVFAFCGAWALIHVLQENGAEPW